MAPIAISRDGLDYERRGRIIGEDQHKGAIRARVRELMAMGGGRAGSHTAVTPSPAQRLGLGKGASRETVLKIVSWTKDRASPLAQARYASRTRTNDPPSGALHMISDDGRELPAARRCSKSSRGQRIEPRRWRRQGTRRARARTTRPAAPCV